jgi:uncharacterized protein (DUF952 family)
MMLSNPNLYDQGLVGLLEAAMELLHITERAVWEAAVRAGSYERSTRGVTLAEQGFIHCLRRHQLRAVVEYVYGDLDDLVVLVIDGDRLAVPVRFEAADAHGPAYPHIYGPLPISAVVEVVPVTRDPSGRLVLPEPA